MDINSMKSELLLEKLFFSSCSVSREKEIKKGELKANFQRIIESLNEHRYSVELRVLLEKDDFKVSVVANAFLKYTGNNPDQERVFIQNNAVAIIFPFVRSQVTLLTSQPDLAPIVLPPIDITKYIENE